MTDVLMVIPFVDEVEQLGEVLQEIRRQRDELNGSNSKTLNFHIVCVNNRLHMPKEIIKLTELPNVDVVHERNSLGSPYSSRNRGIEFMPAKAYLFLDATCVPAPGWVDGLYEHLQKGFDLVAANVVIGDKKDHQSDIGMLYDAITNVDNEKAVEELGAAKTACLLVHERVINSIGAFEENVRSGGDIAWTRKATRAGFNLNFDRNWKVLKSARNSKELIHKQWRVALAFPRICNNRKEMLSMILRKVFFMWLPPKLSYLSRTAKRREIEVNKSEYLKLFFFGWQIRLLTGVAVIVGLVKKRLLIRKPNSKNGT